MDEAEEAPKKPFSALVWVGIVLALSLVVGTCITSGGSSEPATPTGPTQSAAIRVCHQNVEGKLRAPSTADFGGDVATATAFGYTVRGYVDAENGFGANIRTSWTCDAIHVSGDNWRTRAALIEG